MSASGYYQGERRDDITVGRNAEGDREAYYSGEGSGPGIRTHDYSNEDEVNEKLFGKGAVKRQNTSTRTNADGDREEHWDGDEAPGIRTHDHSDENAINEKLFGRNAPKPPSRTNTSGSRSSGQTQSYTNADGDREESWAGENAPGIRTHDHSNEDEVNERLFGKGAKNARD